jgi:hypothetical protein
LSIFLLAISDDEENSLAITKAKTYPWRIVELFAGEGRGAVRRMARRCGLRERAVYNWTVRGRIPSSRHAELFAAARRLGVPLKPEHFFDLPDDAEDDEDGGAMPPRGETISQICGPEL